MSILIAFLGGMLTLLSPLYAAGDPAAVRQRPGPPGAAGDHAGRNGADVRRCLLAGDGRQRLGGESDPRRPRSGAGVLRPGRVESAFATRRATADLTPGSVGESA